MYDLMILVLCSQMSSKGHRAWCLLNHFWSYSICAKVICLYHHMVNVLAYVSQTQQTGRRTHIGYSAIRGYVPIRPDMLLLYSRRWKEVPSACTRSCWPVDNRQLDCYGKWNRSRAHAVL